MKAPNPLHKLITVHQPHPLPMMHVPPCHGPEPASLLWWRSTTKDGFSFCLPPLLISSPAPLELTSWSQEISGKNIFHALTNPAETVLLCYRFCFPFERLSLFQCHPTDSSLAHQESSEKGKSHSFSPILSNPPSRAKNASTEILASALAPVPAPIWLAPGVEI
jgi:hypothetical protein